MAGVTVVGYDGSECSQSALETAIDMAREQPHVAERPVLVVPAD